MFRRNCVRFYFIRIFLLLLTASAIKCNNASELPKGDPGNGGLFLPGNFEAVVVADSTGPARHIAINDNGDIYIKMRYSKRGEGNLALRDLNGDGKADSTVHFGDYDNEGSLSNCVRIHDGYLYFASELVVYRMKLTPGQLVPGSKLEVVLTDDTKRGTHWHITKPISFDDNGHMYVPFGSPSNACQDLIRTPGGTPGFAGLDPCPELEQHAGIWEFDANKIGLTQEDGKKFATGLRSVVAMDWNKDDKNLYVVMHGRDDLHMLWPGKFTQWQSAVLPSEEFLRVKDGNNFGWPYSYYGQHIDERVKPPRPEMVAKAIAPDYAIGSHTAPLGLASSVGTTLPAPFANGMFIGQHGSWNRRPHSGYKVIFVPFERGKPSGVPVDVLTGFLSEEGNAFGRPVGVALDKAGALLVADDVGNVVWRVSAAR